jgi:glycosyltransferase involved in cell wall biosynthesis
MLISVCIPHYNRSRYLLAVLESIRVQDHPNVEVIISDDCSSDDSYEVIPKYIAAVEGSTHVRFDYFRQPKNLGYDGNLRAALGAGQGEYLFVLGNDDALPERDTLSKLAGILAQLNYPDISFTNFHPCGKPDEVQRRAKSTAVIGSGPEIALETFRSFSFVGGLVMRRAAFKKHNTGKHDGSVYVQIYLAARTIASGGVLGTISESMVAKDVNFPGEEVNSYLDTLTQKNRGFHAELGGLDQVGLVGCDAILPYIPSKSRQRYILRIYAQLLFFTYSYWLFTYRKHNVYRAAVNLALGCFPTNLIRVSGVSFYVYLLLMSIWVGSTLAGLLVPLSILGKMTGLMSRLSKSIRPGKWGLSNTKLELPAN